MIIADKDARTFWAYSDADDRRIALAKRFVQIFMLLFATVIGWAYFATLDEVSTGTGKIVPTSQEQVIQSLEGGVLSKLYVRQDDIVEPGQILAQLDPTVTESTIEETAAKYRAALAKAARLNAEVSLASLKFPAELDAHPDLREAETALYNVRKEGLDDRLRWISEALKLNQEELAISTSLLQSGAASNVEVIRLKRQVAELQLKQSEAKAGYVVQAREELSKTNADIESLSSVIRGRSDSLSRMALRSPVRGIVKDISVYTIGGVVPPNGKLMVIVPLDDKLLVEARISPRDIAYIHPNQRASVKLTAYDYSIYGGLEGKVVSISPDTIRDEAKPDIYYYRVLIRTGSDALITKDDRRFPIVPGMVATVDIHTGNKTVLDYLIKPLNKAGEAMRER